MVQAGFEPRTPAWLLATLPIEPRNHSEVVVYCTYLTHFRTLPLYDWRTDNKIQDVRRGLRIDFKAR